MSRFYKPAGYNSVSPYLIVSDAAGTITFLEAVFGGRELRRFPGQAGKIMHAEVRLDDTVVMLADDPQGGHGVPAHLHVYVDDVDEVYRQALAMGAESVQEPLKKEDEDRRGGVRDPGGTTWWISTMGA